MRRCSLFVCCFSVRAQTASVRSLYALFTSQRSFWPQKDAPRFFFLSLRLSFRPFLRQFQLRNQSINKPKQTKAKNHDRLAPQTSIHRSRLSCRNYALGFCDASFTRSTQPSRVSDHLLRSSYIAPANAKRLNPLEILGKDMTRRNTRPSSFYARLLSQFFCGKCNSTARRACQQKIPLLALASALFRDTTYGEIDDRYRPLTTACWIELDADSWLFFDVYLFHILCIPFLFLLISL